MPGGPGPRGRLLVVDDDAAVRRALGRELHADFDVVTVEDGAAALAVLAQGEDFGAVVSDLVMPGLPGTKLLAEVGRRRPGCARVLVSGNLEGAGPDVLADGVADVVVAKPWRFGEVAAAVRRALGKSAGRS